ncbi:uncharacterized protein LOC128958487 [Oppia nitens]|uniref:uncharacterized protein LOC128958487 n=1 Tax=Oppia nitens TaxID=1686743 RepID=UPI0023DA3D44|nr:uncharacterized protein LOC128958487 [Oppia nitens]
MFRFIALSALLVVCAARSYNGMGGGYGGGYGGGNGGYGGYGGHSIELPVKSSHRIEVIPVHSSGESHATYVDVPGGVLPVYMTFRTQSSPVHVNQVHRGSKGSYQSSSSKDEPHVLVHEVTKPVIQELREVITPFRKVVQVIEPVREEVLTKVHKGERGGYGGNDGGNGGYGGNDGYKGGY